MHTRTDPLPCHLPCDGLSSLHYLPKTGVIYSTQHAILEYCREKKNRRGHSNTSISFNANIGGMPKPEPIFLVLLLLTRLACAQTPSPTPTPTEEAQEAFAGDDFSNK